mgnify:CR=1 FL=1
MEKLLNVNRFDRLFKGLLLKGRDCCAFSPDHLHIGQAYKAQHCGQVRNSKIKAFGWAIRVDTSSGNGQIYLFACYQAFRAILVITESMAGAYHIVNPALKSRWDSKVEERHADHKGISLSELCYGLVRACKYLPLGQGKLILWGPERPDLQFVQMGKWLNGKIQFGYRGTGIVLGKLPCYGIAQLYAERLVAPWA